MKVYGEWFDAAMLDALTQPVEQRHTLRWRFLPVPAVTGTPPGPGAGQPRP